MSAWLIARRELGALFRTPAGSLIAAFVLFLDALQLNAVAIGTGRRPSGEVLEIFLLNAAFVTEVLAVLLSMRLVVEPLTAPLLLSAPVRERDVVLGKVSAAFVFLTVVTAATLYLPALVYVYGKVSIGHVAAGYLGLLLVGAASLGVGAAAAAATTSPFVAVVVSAAVLGTLELMYYVAGVASLEWRDALRALAPVWKHHRSFRRGILQLSDVVYLVAMAYVGVYVAVRLLGRRRDR